eukprot:scaffold20196_cov69-Phaeocystis_antarctica.AAC.4
MSTPEGIEVSKTRAKCTPRHRLCFACDMLPSLLVGSTSRTFGSWVHSLRTSGAPLTALPRSSEASTASNGPAEAKRLIKDSFATEQYAKRPADHRARRSRSSRESSRNTSPRSERACPPSSKKSS